MVFIGVNILGKFVERLVESMQLSSVNRILGVFFSLCKMLLITGILLLYIDRLDRQVNLLPPHSREQSLFYKPFTSVVRALFPSLEAPDSYDKDHTEFV
jgi:membrane protein required for colicin V production